MIFVFGSNLAGRHGKGAALHARQKYGAELGVGEGRTGNAYAIPTKDQRLQPMHLIDIEYGYLTFTSYARNNPREWFLLTPFGTGLAGHPKKEIAEMVRRIGVPDNVALSHSWLTDRLTKEQS